MTDKNDVPTRRHADAGRESLSASPHPRAPAPLRLRVTSDPANLAPVRHELESFARACGFGEAARGEIVLCVNEAMTNITRHAYDGATDQPIELSATFDDDLLRVTLRDWGTGRTPRRCDPTHDPLRPGGVGMICLRELMNRITFTPQPDGMLLVMERKLKGSGFRVQGSGVQNDVPRAPEP